MERVTPTMVPRGTIVHCRCRGSLTDRGTPAGSLPGDPPIPPVKQRQPDRVIICVPVQAGPGMSRFGRRITIVISRSRPARPARPADSHISHMRARARVSITRFFFCILFYEKTAGRAGHGNTINHIPWTRNGHAWTTTGRGEQNQMVRVNAAWTIQYRRASVLTGGLHRDPPQATAALAVKISEISFRPPGEREKWRGSSLEDSSIRGGTGAIFRYLSEKNRTEYRKHSKVWQHSKVRRDRRVCFTARPSWRSFWRRAPVRPVRGKGDDVSL